MLIEVVIALLLTGLFIAAVWTYLGSSKLGDRYFMDFYAADIATSAQIAAAGNGDVNLRYDNLKQNLPLTFWLENGRVAVDGLAETEIEPKSASIGTYGIVPEYPTGPAMHRNPAYLGIRKVGESLSIADIEGATRTCPRPRMLALEKGAITVHATVTGLTDGERAQFATALKQGLDGLGIPLTEKAADANLQVTLTIDRATTPNLAADATTQDAARIACLFAEQLSSVTGTPFPRPDATATASATPPIAITIAVTLADKRTVTPQQMATATTLTVARYLR